MQTSTDVYHKKNSTDLEKDLGDGLLLKQATEADTEPYANKVVDQVADFAVAIHGTDSLRPCVHDLMSGRHPTTNASDFILVVDTNQKDQIVAMGMSLNQTWSYAGIPFGVGNPELVGTRPDYRRRGLMRAVMDGLHRVSAMRGHLAQAVYGERWIYRQFDYEYALEVDTSRQLHLSDVSRLPDGETEHFQIRALEEDDIPTVMPLYESQRQNYLVTHQLDESLRKFDVSGHSPESDLGVWSNAVVDAEGHFVGYYTTWGDPWGAFTVKELGVVESVALRSVLPTILRHIKRMRETMAEEFVNHGPSRINFVLGATHPVYDVLDAHLEPIRCENSWYLRVPDLAAFLRHISPVLEERLANSIMHDFRYCP